MKRLCLILFVLLLAAPAMAEEPLQLARMSGPMLGSGVVAADPCGCQASSYLFCYTGDHASGAGYACFTSGANAKDATEVDPGTNVSVSTDYVAVTGTDSYVQWGVSSNDGFSSSAGTLYFSVYVVDDGNSDVDNLVWFEIVDDVNNWLLVYVTNASNTFTVHWNGQGTIAKITKTSALNLATWYRVGVAWDAAGNNLSLSIVSLGSSHSWEDGSGLTFDTFAASADLIRIGENIYGTGSDDTSQIANVVIFNSYKASDPL